MPKKNWTPEERAAFGAKMKAARTAKEKSPAYKSSDPSLDTAKEWEIGSGRNQLLEDTVLGLQKQLQELMAERSLERANAAHERPGFGNQGTLIGSFERYITDAKWYPDPIDRLASEPRLRQYWIKKSDWQPGDPANYELKWSVSTTQYETIDNRRVKEPRFTLELIRILKFNELPEKQQNELVNTSRRMWDPEEDTGKRFVTTRGIFHEDPDAAIEIAGRNNVVVDDQNQKAFLDEMRYLRFKDWLLEAFYPPKSDPKENTSDVVIGNKLVEVYTVSHEASQSKPHIPFETMTNKL